MSRSIAAALSLAALVACSGGPAAEDPRVRPAATPTPAPPPVVLCVGTSITAGFGLQDPSQAWPELLQKKVDAEGLRYRVMNAGVSGETSAGARARIDWLLRLPVAVFVLETGANDALRGLDTDALRDNIEAVITRVQGQQPPPRIVLAAMEAPPNLGADYTRRFRAVYPAVASGHGVVLMPFLLDGVAGVPELNMPDGIHPTADGHRRVALNVWKTLRPLL